MEPPASPWALMYYYTNDIPMTLGGHFCSKTIKMIKKWLHWKFMFLMQKLENNGKFSNFHHFRILEGPGTLKRVWKAIRIHYFSTPGPRGAHFSEKSWKVTFYGPNDKHHGFSWNFCFFVKIWLFTIFAISWLLGSRGGPRGGPEGGPQGAPPGTLGCQKKWKTVTASINGLRFQRTCN